MDSTHLWLYANARRRADFAAPRSVKKRFPAARTTLILRDGVTLEEVFRAVLAAPGLQRTTRATLLALEPKAVSVTSDGGICRFRHDPKIVRDIRAIEVQIRQEPLDPGAVAEYLRGRHAWDFVREARHHRRLVVELQLAPPSERRVLLDWQAREDALWATATNAHLAAFARDEAEHGKQTYEQALAEARKTRTTHQRRLMAAAF